MQSLIPVVMAGIIAVYSLVIAVLIAGAMDPSKKYSLFKYVPTSWLRRTNLMESISGFLHLAAGLSVGLTGLAAGYAIGIVGDAVCFGFGFFTSESILTQQGRPGIHATVTDLCWHGVDIDFW